MKRKITFTVVVLLIAGLVYVGFNWKPILLSLSGFEHPRIEDAGTLTAWTRTQKARYDMLAAASSRAAYDSIQTNLRIPGIIIFNQEGLPVVSSQGEGCQVVARNKLKTIQPGDSLTPQYGGLALRSFNDLKKHLTPLTGSWQEWEQKARQADYIVVYSWAKYFPDKSLDMIEAVEEGIRETKARILVMSVSMDFMDSWTEGEAGDKIPLDM